MKIKVIIVYIVNICFLNAVAYPRGTHFDGDKYKRDDEVGYGEMKHHQLDTGLPVAIPDQRQKHGHIADCRAYEECRVHQNAHERLRVELALRTERVGLLEWK